MGCSNEESDECFFRRWEMAKWGLVDHSTQETTVLSDDGKEDFDNYFFNYGNKSFELVIYCIGRAQNKAQKRVRRSEKQRWKMQQD